MRIWTWGEIRQKVENDMDLTGESFISTQELIGYGNDAIDDAEKEIITIYENYFETVASIDLEAGFDTYDLPEDIFANKINQVFIVKSGYRYKINPIKRLSELENYDANTSTDVCYKYRVFNATTGPQIRLFPTPTQNVSDGIELWYIRNASQIVDDDSIVDIPEAANFIIQFVKDKCKNKEVGMSDSGDSSALAQQRQRLIESLEHRINDEEDAKLESDYSFYTEQDYSNDF